MSITTLKNTKFSSEKLFEKSFTIYNENTGVLEKGMDNDDGTIDINNHLFTAVESGNPIKKLVSGSDELELEISEGFTRDVVNNTTFQWLADGVAIPGEEKTSYAIQSSDVGKEISLEVSWTDVTGAQYSQTSRSTTITDSNFSTANTIDIEGFIKEGAQSPLAKPARTLTDLKETNVYIWKRDGVVDPTITSTSYIPSVEDEGVVFSVLTEFDDANGVLQSTEFTLGAVLPTQNSVTLELGDIYALLPITTNLRYGAGDDIQDIDGGLSTFTGFRLFVDGVQIGGTVAAGINTVFPSLDASNIGKQVYVEYVYQDLSGNTRTLTSPTKTVQARNTTTNVLNTTFQTPVPGGNLEVALAEGTSIGKTEYSIVGEVLLDGSVNNTISTKIPTSAKISMTNLVAGQTASVRFTYTNTSGTEIVIQSPDYTVGGILDDQVGLLGTSLAGSVLNGSYDLSTAFQDIQIDWYIDDTLQTSLGTELLQYTPIAADAGKEIYAKVTYKNYAGVTNVVTTSTLTVDDYGIFLTETSGGDIRIETDRLPIEYDSNTMTISWYKNGGLVSGTTSTNFFIDEDDFDDEIYAIINVSGYGTYQSQTVKATSLTTKPVAELFSHVKAGRALVDEPIDLNLNFPILVGDDQPTGANWDTLELSSSTGETASYKKSEATITHSGEVSKYTWTSAGSDILFSGDFTTGTLRRNILRQNLISVEDSDFTGPTNINYKGNSPSKTLVFTPRASANKTYTKFIGNVKFVSNRGLVLNANRNSAGQFISSAMPDTSFSQAGTHVFEVQVDGVSLGARLTHSVNIEQFDFDSITASSIELNEINDIGYIRFSFGGVNLYPNVSRISASFSNGNTGLLLGSVVQHGLNDYACSVTWDKSALPTEDVSITITVEDTDGTVRSFSEDSDFVGDAPSVKVTPIDVSALASITVDPPRISPGATATVRVAFTDSGALLDQSDLNLQVSALANPPGLGPLTRTSTEKSVTFDSSDSSVVTLGQPAPLGYGMPVVQTVFNIPNHGFDNFEKVMYRTTSGSAAPIGSNLVAGSGVKSLEEDIAYVIVKIDNNSFHLARNILEASANRNVVITTLGSGDSDRFISAESTVYTATYTSNASTDVEGFTTTIQRPWSSGDIQIGDVLQTVISADDYDSRLIGGNDITHSLGVPYVDSGVKIIDYNNNLVPAMTGLFGNSELDQSTGRNVYTVPSAAESFAGFANEDSSIYPICVERSGATLTFTGNVVSGNSVDIYFKFEKLPYDETTVVDGVSQSTLPDLYPLGVDGLGNPNLLTISGNTDTTYTVDIPAQAQGITFSSMLMYIVTRDEDVIIENISLNGVGKDISNLAIAGSNVNVNDVGIYTHQYNYLDSNNKRQIPQYQRTVRIVNELTIWEDTFILQENSEINAAGVDFYQIKAAGAGTLTYSKVAGDNKFQVSPSGMVTLTSPLVHTLSSENPKIYPLTVSVTNGIFTVQEVIEIKLYNVDTAPDNMSFSSSSFYRQNPAFTSASGGTILMPENLQDLYVAEYATLTNDTAGSEDTPLTYFLTSDTDPEFYLSEAGTSVYLNTAPDYETKKEYHLGVYVVDGGGNASSPVTKDFEVIPSNDEAPKFGGPSSRHVGPQTSARTGVLATDEFFVYDPDLDSVSNAPTVTLTGSSDTNGTTGWFTWTSSASGTGGSLTWDKDVTPPGNYVASFELTDGINTRTQDITVVVGTSNPPDFISGTEVTGILDNIVSGTSLYTASAVCADPNDDPIYELVDDMINLFGGNAVVGTASFAIDSSTGVVTNLEGFTQDHVITIKATDPTTGSFSLHRVNLRTVNDTIGPTFTTTNGVTFDRDLGYTVGGSAEVLSIITFDDNTGDLENFQITAAQNGALVAGNLEGQTDENNKIAVVLQANAVLSPVPTSLSMNVVGTDVNGNSNNVALTLNIVDMRPNISGLSSPIEFNAYPATSVTSGNVISGALAGATYNNLGTVEYSFKNGTDTGAFVTGADSTLPLEIEKTTGAIRVAAGTHNVNATGTTISETIVITDTNNNKFREYPVSIVIKSESAQINLSIGRDLEFPMSLAKATAGGVPLTGFTNSTGSNVGISYSLDTTWNDSGLFTMSNNKLSIDYQGGSDVNGNGWSQYSSATSTFNLSIKVKATDTSNGSLIAENVFQVTFLEELSSSGNNMLQWSSNPGPTSADEFGGKRNNYSGGSTNVAQYTSTIISTGQGMNSLGNSGYPVNLAFVHQYNGSANHRVTMVMEAATPGGIGTVPNHFTGRLWAVSGIPAAGNGTFIDEEGPTYTPFLTDVAIQGGGDYDYARVDTATESQYAGQLLGWQPGKRWLFTQSSSNGRYQNPPVQTAGYIRFVHTA